jgi:hypothetical protein
MNDESYLGDRTNKLVGNSVVVIVMMISFTLAVVSIPLQIFGGG